MPTPDTLTWDLETPRRPSIDDLGGGAKIEGIPRPDPANDLTADDVNQWAGQAEAFGRTTYVLRVSVRFTAGAPFIYKIQQPGTKSIADDTVNVVDNGTGDVTVTWTDGTLPPLAASEPDVTVNGSTPGFASAELVTGPVGARVRVKNGSNVAADLPFTVTVY
jgi:hypothetical protein